MNYMIASDIHGSAFWCRELLNALEREGAERLILLGDLLYHGPRNPMPEDYAPQEVAAMLNPLRNRLLCVRGNCDAEVDQMVLDFPIMADCAVLPVGERLLYLTHGHIHNTQNPPPICPGDLLIHGHTHVPAWERFGMENLCCNPGSVALPKKESAHGYMLLRDGVLEWKTTDGECYHTEKL